MQLRWGCVPVMYDFDKVPASVFLYWPKGAVNDGIPVHLRTHKVAKVIPDRGRRRTVEKSRQEERRLEITCHILYHKC